MYAGVYIFLEKVKNDLLPLTLARHKVSLERRLSFHPIFNAGISHGSRQGLSYIPVVHEQDPTLFYQYIVIYVRITFFLFSEIHRKEHCHINGDVAVFFRKNVQQNDVSLTL